MKLEGRDIKNQLTIINQKRRDQDGHFGHIVVHDPDEASTQRNNDYLN